MIRTIVQPFVDLVRRRLSEVSSEGGDAWRGVFKAMAEVPARGPGLEGPWVQMASRLARHLLGRVESVEGFHGDGASLLPLLVAAVQATIGRCRVLDFGGGAGVSFLETAGRLATLDGVEIHVVERPAVCEAGRRVLGGRAGVTFHETLDAAPREIDVVHVDSALQYVEDYRGLLRTLCAFRAPFILFVRASLVPAKTFASAQVNVPGTVVPYWFIGADELLELLDAEGYRRAFFEKSTRVYGQGSLPPELRMHRTSNLLFTEGGSLARLPTRS